MEDNIKEYKGFEVISYDDIPDFASKGIHLRHKKTGIEVYHLFNNDVENLCSFCFRTLPDCSNGFAHILEHSVLCGSQKFPLRDPFINLENQSLKTFLNAMTSTDNTMYPVSSVIEEDYFNLMSVYADSVFFPNLKKEAFMQEAYHLEKDAEGKYSIQGVVYNEMKGVYSSFDAACTSAVCKSIIPETIYVKDSGGDPAEIPSLTYEQYLEYYNRFYRPDNCFVFLYGNIPTEKQLDFLQECLIDRLEEKLDSFPVQTNTALEILKNEKAPVFEKTNRIEVLAPNVAEKDKEEDPSVFFSWRLKDTINIEDIIKYRLISQILVQNDGSPLLKAIIDSGLAKEVSPLSSSFVRGHFNFFTVGVDGIKKNKVEKLKKIINKTIENLVKNGIDQDDIDSALMDIEISTKEVKRASGPYSLVLLRRAFKQWMMGESPSDGLHVQKAFDNVKKKIKEDDKFLVNLLKEYFIDNNQTAVCVVTPSPEFAKKYRTVENEQIELLKSKISDEQLDEDILKLRTFQQQDETELLKCLPHINARKIKYSIPQIKTQFEMLEYCPDKKVPFMCNVENTNGINYFSICFPFDVLDTEDYDYLSLLMYMITEIGWKDLPWDKATRLANKYSADFYCDSFIGECSNTELGKNIRNEYSKYGFIGREWMCMRVKMLAENTKPTLDYISDCILYHNLKDIKRIKLLFDEFLLDFESSLSENGHFYMGLIAASFMNRSKAVHEVLSGITNLYFLRSIKGKYKLISRRLTEIAKKIFSSGAVIDLVCDSSSKTAAVEDIKKFAEKLSLKQPEAVNPENTFKKIKNLIKVKKENSDELCFEKDVQVGYGACHFECSPYSTLEAAAEAVYAHWLSNSLLWERIRTVCGAYGAFADNDSLEQIFTVMTYRDPDPEKSILEISKCLKEGAEHNFTEDEVEKAVTGAFSSELKPRTPKALGYVGFTRFLTCIHQEDVNNRIRLTLQVTPQDMHKAAVRLYENSLKHCSKAMFCIKGKKTAGKTDRIEL